MSLHRVMMIDSGLTRSFSVWLFCLLCVERKEKMESGRRSLKEEERLR